MPDEIDLGDGVTAEFCDGEFRLSDVLSEDCIDLGIEAARKLARFIDEKAGKE